MKVHVLEGTKVEIAEQLLGISGEVRKVLVIVEEPDPEVVGEESSADVEDMFAEMRPFMVNSPTVDDSREAVATGLEGE